MCLTTKFDGVYRGVSDTANENTSKSHKGGNLSIESDRITAVTQKAQFVF